MHERRQDCEPRVWEMTSVSHPSGSKVESVKVSAFRIPTASPEADGTLTWDATTMVVVEPTAAGVTGFGYTYADAATARLIKDSLVDAVIGRDGFDIPGAWAAMASAVRNLGRPGIASMGISALDIALWDLKARMLDLPLARLLGQIRSELPVYGSGGFTSYSTAELVEQLSGWVQGGMSMVKMKVGRDARLDVARVESVRAAIGDAELFVDANGAYGPQQALDFAWRVRDLGVTWLEEPVPSDDLEGLRGLRERCPPGMEVAAGEYGYSLLYFERMLGAHAVDVAQVDVTRCGGISEFLRVAAVCAAHSIPVSSHCAPALHVALGCAVDGFRHAEYFFDHARIENGYIEGAPVPRDGVLRPDLQRRGLGLELRAADVARWRIEV